MEKNDVNFRVTADKLRVGDICYVVGDEGIRTVTVKRIQTYDNGKEFTITYDDGCVGSARPNDKETGYGSMLPACTLTLAMRYARWRTKSRGEGRCSTSSSRICTSTTSSTSKRG